MTTTPPKTSPTHHKRRPLFGLRDKPGHLALALMRMPLRAYRHNAGWVFDHTFLQFTHIGRKTGQPHEAVAMVLSYDPSTCEAVICAAWGPDTDWFRNLKAQTAQNVRLGRASFTPEQRFLTDEQAFEVAVRFRTAHPRRLRLLSGILGWGNLSDDERVREFVRGHPFLAFRPTSHAVA